MRKEAIDVKAQISEKYRDEKFYNTNKNFQKFDLDKNKKITLWQQMPINYFFNLLKEKQLYFKQFSEYDCKDERPFSFYKKNYPSQNLHDQKIIEDFVKTAYISCWYQSDNLTDIVFKEYAKGSVGVAIKTTVSILLNTLQDPTSIRSSTKIENELFYGDTIYLSDKICKELVLPSRADLISPFFIKSENHNDDKEFRLVYVMNSAYKKQKNFQKIEQDNLSKSVLLQVEPRELIQAVAVKRDDLCTLNLTEYLLNNFLEKSITNDEMDGFSILCLK